MSERPFRLVCPVCRATLLDVDGHLRCPACGADYRCANGFPDLIVGPRFDDPSDAARASYEEQANDHTCRHYLLPLFRRLFPETAAPLRLLSVGCGTGADVDALAEAGFDIAGIDCGNRTDVWPRRRSLDRLYLANGRNLPFEDATFDAAYCGCVFPHVGTVGDSPRVAPDCREQRSALACEMTRVLKPGGFILVSSPNRLCPVDLFHGRSERQPFPRLNPPASRFLLSAADYAGLFRDAGCHEFTLLPPAGYWGFVNRRKTWTGRLLTFPVECVFRMVSVDALRFLRGAPFSPWLVMLLRKPGEAGR